MIGLRKERSGPQRCAQPDHDPPGPIWPWCGEITRSAAAPDTTHASECYSRITSPERKKGNKADRASTDHSSTDIRTLKCSNFGEIRPHTLVFSETLPTW